MLNLNASRCPLKVTLGVFLLPKSLEKENILSWKIIREGSKYFRGTWTVVKPLASKNLNWQLTTISINSEGDYWWREYILFLGPDKPLTSKPKLWSWNCFHLARSEGSHKKNSPWIKQRGTLGFNPFYGNVQAINFIFQLKVHVRVILNQEV